MVAHRSPRPNGSNTSRIASSAVCRVATRSSPSSPQWATQPTTSSRWRTKSRPTPAPANTTCSSRPANRSRARSWRWRSRRRATTRSALPGSKQASSLAPQHTAGRIHRVEAQRVQRELDAGRIPVIAGFQGITEEFEIVTLGRGASDLTGIVLAISLKAGRYENCKDVTGIYTTDPRIVPEARQLKDVTYEEMLELASQGSQVLHNRAVEIASVYNLPILVTSSFVDAPGTLIHGEENLEERNKIRAIAHDTDVAKITVRQVPDQPGIAAHIFEPLANAGISVDTIVQNASDQRVTDLTFTVKRSDLKRAEILMPGICASVAAEGFNADGELGKVSIVGVGIQTAHGYAARMFRALFDAGINIELITTSEIRLTCIIPGDRVQDAVRALHAAFELEKPDAD
jgi:aspartate kinase